MDTVTLTDHDEIRNWAAARMGAPAMSDVSPEGGMQPMLMFVFDQAAYQDQDQPTRPPNAGGVDIVEWDEWFEVFDERQLAVVVAEDVPGTRDSFYEIVRRG